MWGLSLELHSIVLKLSVSAFCLDGAGGRVAVKAGIQAFLEAEPPATAPASSGILKSRMGRFTGNGL